MSTEWEPITEESHMLRPGCDQARMCMPRHPDGVDGGWLWIRSARTVSQFRKWKGSETWEFRRPVTAQKEQDSSMKWKLIDSTEWELIDDPKYVLRQGVDQMRPTVECGRSSDWTFVRLDQSTIGWWGRWYPEQEYEFRRPVSSPEHAVTQQPEIEPVNNIATVCNDLRDLLLRKNHDYGNSATQPPVLRPDIPARAAIEVRISDKISRWRQLASGTDPQVQESLEDTVRDLAGYCVLWLCADGGAR